MISPEQLRKKLDRIYQSFLGEWVKETEGFFPVYIPVGKIPKKDYLALREGILALKTDAEKWNYELLFETKTLRTLGEKTYPTQIIIPNQDALLSILKKQTEFTTFQNNVELLRKHLPQLEDWLGDNVKLLLKYHDVWVNLIKVCEYFIIHPKPDCYIRELPIEVHTKFVESYKPILSVLLDELLPSDSVVDTEKKFEKRYGLRYNEPLVRIRILDDRICSEHSFPFADMSIQLSDSIANPIHATNCMVIENKMTFLALPQLTNTIAIWGQGKRASTLRHLTWLKQVNIYYWGDLDVDGFIILSKLRSNFPHVASFMMDETTYNSFEKYSVSNIPSATPSAETGQQS